MSSSKPDRSGYPPVAKALWSMSKWQGCCRYEMLNFFSYQGFFDLEKLYKEINRTFAASGNKAG